MHDIFNEINKNDRNANVTILFNFKFIMTPNSSRISIEPFSNFDYLVSTNH